MHSLAAQRPELLADILLPSAVRERIRAQAPDCVLVVPDGALHKLPFEALLLRADESPSYVLDELPPLAYAPSVSILAQLAERKGGAPAGELQSLLTVADPEYRPADKRGELRHLIPLPSTLRESQSISRVFQRHGKQVHELHGKEATKRALVAALPGPQVI